MSNQINVLVLGVGGNVSQGIITALRHSNLKCKIIGACISSESLGLFFCDKAYISPYANDPNFIEWVSEVCKKDKINIVLSGVEENIVALEHERKNLIKLGIPFFNTSLKYLNIGNDKLLTCKWLKENGLNYPKFAEASNTAQVNSLISEVGFPIIAKPIKGKGSNGIFIIKDMDSLRQSPTKGYIYQQILGTADRKYTVGCYVDKDGKLRGMIMMQRWLKHGTTFKAKIVHNPDIKKECERICKHFKAVGPLNIQLRLHNGKPTCFELNVRFSGTTPLRAHWGFNDVETFVKEHLFNAEPELDPAKEGIAYRYYNEAYIDPQMQKNICSNLEVEKVGDFINEKENL